MRNWYIFDNDDFCFFVWYSETNHKWYACLQDKKNTLGHRVMLDKADVALYIKQIMQKEKEHAA